MATAGAKPFDCTLSRVGSLNLEDDSCNYPEYTGVVVLPQDMLMVVDSVAFETERSKLRLCSCHDGKLLATSDILQVQPHDVCVLDESETQVAMTRLDGKIEILSFEYTGRSAAIRQVRILDATTVFEYCHGVRALKSRKQLVVSGGIKDKDVQMYWFYWGILSINDGHVHAVYKICKSGGGCYASSSYLATSADDKMVFISCCPDTHYHYYNGVYAFDLMNGKRKFVYRHNDLTSPKGISVDREGFVYVCNWDPSCIHQLTVRGEPVTIHMRGMPPDPLAMYWKESQKELYVTSNGSREVWRLSRMLSDQQEDHTAPEVLVSDERKQPATEKTSTGIEQRFVDTGHSSVEIAIPPSVPVPKDSEEKQVDDKASEVLMTDKRKPVIEEASTQIVHEIADKQQSSVDLEISPSVPVPEEPVDSNLGPVIPVEILRMDDKSLQLYKAALQDGKEKVYNIRVMVVGQFGAGKTTLTKRLLGKPVNISERKSTEGIDVYKHCCKISLDTGEWIVQQEDSDEVLRLQRLLKFLTGQTERLEDSAEQKEHIEDIYQRETTPEDLHSQVHYIESDDDTSSDRGVIHINDSSVSSESDSDQEFDINKSQLKGSSFVEADQRLPSLEASSVMIQEDESHATSKNDAMIEILKLVNEKADKLERSRVKYAVLAVSDFAGQYIFYTTHQMFLTCRAIYLLVTDLSQQITDLVEDDECFFDTEGVKLCKVQDLVEVWLNSVHCCAQSSATGTDSNPDNSVTSPAADTLLISHGFSTPVPYLDVGIPVTPPVILVGTHMDKIQQDKRQEVVSKYFQQICRILKDKPSLQHLVGFLAIDNTQLDPQLEILKKQIFQLASRQPYWGEEVPVNWLLLEEALMKLKASGIKVIPHSLVDELNEAAAVPIKNTEQLDLFLRFEHETGNILYFSVEGLKEYIVLDPQWLIDALKSLITAETFVFNYNPAVWSLWFEFKQNGKLTSQLIDAIWTKEKHPEFHQNKEIILQLMEKLNIVARPRLYNPDAAEVKEEGYFLVPCMLRQATPKDLISLGPNSQQRNTSVICFVFTGKFLPTPVFHRLLAACVAQWPIARQKTENLIFSGCCLFLIDLRHRLTLLLREHGIFARITTIGITENVPSCKLCVEVREFLTRTLSSIIGCLGQSLQFELSIQCPQSDRYSVDYQIPFATLQGNVDVPCHLHDKSHVIISHDVLKFWFHDEEQSSDGPSVVTMPTPPTSDTDRFMCIAYLLNDVGSKVLRKLFLHMVVTPFCSLDQHLAKNMSTIQSLLKKRVLNSSQMNIMFPPSGYDTNLNDYDITLLSALFNNIVPSLGHQEINLVKGLREDRNKLYGHAKSCMMNAFDFQTCWSNISSTLITLSQQCGDPIFENEILQEIQQTRVPNASYLTILQTWFSRIERIEQSLKSSETSLSET